MVRLIFAIWIERFYSRAQRLFSICGLRENGGWDWPSLFTIYKSFRKIRLKSKWIIPFGSFQRKTSRNNGISEKVVLFFCKECSKWSSWSISSRPSLKPFSGFSRPFFEKGNNAWLVQKVNAIPGRNSPVLDFAYHLPKPWTTRYAHANKNSLSFGTNLLLFLMEIMGAFHSTKTFEKYGNRSKL